jgi:type IV pilus assembly protein PilP
VVVTAPTPEAAPPPLQQEEVNYNPSGRRDPFRSLIVTGGKRNVDLLPPLQRREVSELKFVAVVWGELGTYGMLEMPDGKGYAVRIGTRVGPNRGVVKRITARDLTVVEQYVDFFGETRTRDIVLDLRTREEGLE